MKITIDKAVVEQALEALELMRRRPDICKELRAALNEASKDVEPYGYVTEDDSFSTNKTTLLRKGWKDKQLTRVYTRNQLFGNTEQVKEK